MYEIVQVNCKEVTTMEKKNPHHKKMKKPVKKHTKHIKKNK